MAIKFQYNKTSLQQLEKQLKVRVRTLPIIENKESALRMEAKRCKTEAAGLEERLEKQIQAYEAMFAPVSYTHLDLHEWCNDLVAVSTVSSVKL